MSKLLNDSVMRFSKTQHTNESKRQFCKSAVAGGMALAFGQSLTTASAAQSDCSAKTAEQGFASTFINVPEEFSATRVKFDKPLPEGLSGTLYRNGPARMQRGDTRYNHWFDGDGMVHAFKLQGNDLVHKGKMVATARSIAEEKAGRFLWGGFGTAFEDSLSITSPDDVNVANISVLPIGDEVLALWEAGSPYRVHAETLETLGRHVFSPETDGMAFSAHPRVDPQGRIWNFGYLSGTGKLALYDLNADGSLNRAAVIDAPNADMVHDFVITDDYLVFLLPPLKFKPFNDPSNTFVDAFEWDANGAVEVVVVDKANLNVMNQFQLPAFFAFHFGNAWQEGGTIRIEVATTGDFHPLMDAITHATRGERAPAQLSTSQAMEVKLDLSTKQASMQALPTSGVDFPRFDQRFTGQRTDHLFMLDQSTEAPAGIIGFNRVTALNRKTEMQTHFDYGEHVLAEEHIFVPESAKPEGAGWLVGTSYDWQTCRTSLSVFNASHIEDGPICQAELPYSLPMGLHGQFVAAV